MLRDKSPFLKRIKMNKELLTSQNCSIETFPFNIPAIKDIDLLIKQPILIISHDNGSDKSTLLKCIATHCGFNLNGGNQNHLYGISPELDEINKLVSCMRFEWNTKVYDGFFMRSDSFSNFTNFIDEQAKEYGEKKSYSYYGGKSLNKQSHGESFLSLFINRFDKKGIYILDEPEAALSPNKILEFMFLIKQLSDTGKAQFIIATHSPILMAYPDAQFVYIKNNEIKEMNYVETDHYIITKNFLDNPERYFHYLFDEDEQ